MKKSYQKVRENISMDIEIEKLQTLFKGVKDNRASNSCHKLEDILMSGYAMFSLKYPSLLIPIAIGIEEQNKIEKINFKTVFGIEKTCSDTNLRKVLDDVNPNFIRKYISKQFNLLEKSGLISDYQYKIGAKKYLIVSNDGVQHFSSKSCSCDKCLKKNILMVV